MKALYTIGYTKSTLRCFIERLKAAGVDGVIDIRLNNTSQLAGFSKKDDLDFLLGEGFGIDYVHLQELAPTPEILDDYKKSKDWAVYQSRYSRLIAERDMVGALTRLVSDRGLSKPCLLCAEPNPDKCHRRLLAQAVQLSSGNLEVIHL